VIRAVLVTHGRLGEELLRIAQSLVGALEGIDAVSNEGLSLDDLLARIEEKLVVHEGEVCLFTDLFGGSCRFASEAVRRRRGRCEVFSGLNLPMLLDFVHNRERLPFDELTLRLVEKGREGIRRL